MRSNWVKRVRVDKSDCRIQYVCSADLTDGVSSLISIYIANADPPDHKVRKAPKRLGTHYQTIVIIHSRRSCNSFVYLE